MKKVFLFLVLILTAFLIAGCWDAIRWTNDMQNGEPGANNTTTATHKICASGGSITGSAVGGVASEKCVTVNGAGANQCQTDADCVSPIS